MQPVELASFDAWIKYYRPDENSPNTSISYYTKGAVVAFLLDATIRQADQRRPQPRRRDAGRLRSAIADTKGYTADEFRAVAEQVAGDQPGVVLGRGGRPGTAELDYTEALDVFGLRFRSDGRAGRAARAGRGWASTTRNDAGRLLVSQVRRDGAGASRRA